MFGGPRTNSDFHRLVRTVAETDTRENRDALVDFLIRWHRNRREQHRQKTK